MGGFLLIEESEILFCGDCVNVSFFSTDGTIVKLQLNPVKLWIRCFSIGRRVINFFVGFLPVPIEKQKIVWTKLDNWAYVTIWIRGFSTDRGIIIFVSVFYE